MVFLLCYNSVMETTIIIAIITVVPTSITAIIGVANYISSHKNKKVVDTINSKISPITARLKAAEKQLGQVSLDTTRIQMMDEIHRHPDNIDTILKIAERYFVDQKGNWVATSEFIKWAKNNGVAVPTNIATIVEKNVKEENNG